MARGLVGAPPLVRSAGLPAPRAGTDAAVAEPNLAELLIDCEEDRVLRAVQVGMLREADREGEGPG